MYYYSLIYLKLKKKINTEMLAIKFLQYWLIINLIVEKIMNIIFILIDYKAYYKIYF